MPDNSNKKMTAPVGQITTDISDGIGWLKMVNPARHNAMTQEMWRDLPKYISLLDKNTEVRVIIISGEGSDAFCAGADIAEFDRVRKDAETARSYEEENVRAFDAIAECTKPVIAMINGYCLGGGFGIASAADLRIASGDAVFSVPAGKLGLAYPVSSVSYIVDAIGSQFTREILFTARRFSAAEMLERGFLLKISKEGNLQSDAESLARQIVENAPISVSAAKLSIKAACKPENAELKKFAMQVANSTFESADYMEGRNAFKNRRKPVFTGE